MAFPVMPTLRHLPLELLEGVYHCLGSIDDVHNLGRACRATNSVIRRQSVYVEIMRSVISNSSQHRFDISLCRMLDLHRDIVQHFTNGGRPIEPTQFSQNPNAGPLFHPLEMQLVSAVTHECCGGACLDCLPDARIYDILARYQGLRILENQWLARQLDNNDLLSADYSMEHPRVIGCYNSIVTREDVFQDTRSQDSSLDSECGTSFNADHRGRFHAAITGVWLYNEIRWVLTRFTYPSPSFVLQLRLLEACKDWMEKQQGTLLIHELDRHAVFHFMYHHLLPLHGSFMADQDSSKLPLTFQSDLESSPACCARYLQLFLMAGQTYLQPPDLIDLLIRSKISRKPPYPPLPTPESTETWRIPSAVHLFPPNIDYCSPNLSSPLSARLMHLSTVHLNIVVRSTINQCESHPQQQNIGNPGAAALFTVKDDMEDYFREKALTRFDMFARMSVPGKRCVDIRTVFGEEWAETWWKVWWWANSEEKARAKMERWRVGEIS